jgi:hypothetical protein
MLEPVLTHTRITIGLCHPVDDRLRGRLELERELLLRCAMPSTSSTICARNSAG